MPRATAGAQGYGCLGKAWWGAGQAAWSWPGVHGPALRAGNIRLLCRLRPGAPSHLVSVEPGRRGTVTTCYRGRQRCFRLDWVFAPDASQEEVLAVFLSSVLALPQRLVSTQEGRDLTGQAKDASFMSPETEEAV